MTTLTQTKPQPQPQAQTTKQLDAIDGEFDYLIGLRPQTIDYTSDYYKGYKAAADKQGQCPF